MKEKKQSKKEVDLPEGSVRYHGEYVSEWALDFAKVLRRGHRLDERGGAFTIVRAHKRMPKNKKSHMVRRHIRRNRRTQKVVIQ